MWRNSPPSSLPWLPAWQRGATLLVVLGLMALVMVFDTAYVMQSQQVPYLTASVIEPPRSLRLDTRRAVPCNDKATCDGKFHHQPRPMEPPGPMPLGDIQRCLSNWSAQDASTRSRYNEDLITYSKYFNDTLKRPGFFIELGAYDGCVGAAVTRRYLPRMSTEKGWLRQSASGHQHLE
jgi:hypothetical protein